MNHNSTADLSNKKSQQAYDNSDENYSQHGLGRCKWLSLQLMV